MENNKKELNEDIQKLNSALEEANRLLDVTCLKPAKRWKIFFVIFFCIFLASLVLMVPCMFLPAELRRLFTVILSVCALVSPPIFYFAQHKWIYYLEHAELHRDATIRPIERDLFNAQNAYKEH